MCGYACCNCGRCQGETRTRPFGTCLACGAENDPADRSCKQCGAKLVPPPGTLSKTKESSN